MRTKHLSSLALVAMLTIATDSVSATPESSSDKSIYCQTKDNIVTTLAKTHDGQAMPIFHWKKQAFRDQANLQQMCDRVSEKMEQYLVAKGNLSTISFTSVKLENIPTICMSEDNYNCNLVLFTLPPAENPVEIADRLLESILDPKLQQGKKASSERGVQSSSYSVDFWQLVDWGFSDSSSNK